MKSTLRLLSCLVLCLLLAAPALADIDGDFDYYYDETIGGAVLTGYTGSGTDVVVPDTLGGYPLLRVSFGTFQGNSALLSVTLPDSLRYLDGGAFAACPNLATVILPENLIEFTNCGDTGVRYYVDMHSATAQLMSNPEGGFPGNRFVDPDYPDLKLYYESSAGGLMLGFYAYYGSGDTVVLPDFIQIVDCMTIGNGIEPTAIYLPENLMEFANPDYTTAELYVSRYSATASMIPSSKGFIDPQCPAYRLCYMQSPATGGTVLAMSRYIGDAETVIIPDGISHIGESAFMIGVSGAEVNTWTKTVRMPDSVISLGMAALYSLPNLSEVYLSPNISSWYHRTQPWEPGAFSEGAKLYCPLDSTTFRTMTQDVTPLGIVDPGAPDFSWQSSSGGGRVLCAYSGSAASLVIPDGTTEIGRQAFYDNKTLTSITIPESVTHIGDSAFEISDYWSDPDSYCKRNIYLPSGATLGNNPFDIHRTTLVVRHDSATAKELMRLNEEFGEVIYPFSDPQYPDFSLAHFNDELYLIGYTGSNTVVEFPPIVDVIAEHVNLRTPLSGAITHITVPEGVTRLAGRAFWGWPVLKTISLPSTLREIGEYAFSNTSLSVLIIPEGVTSLPAYMTDNSIIRYVTIPASVTSIDDTALITSGGMRTYKIYCNKGSYAETWAKEHKVPVGYLEDNEYSFYIPEQYIGDIGDTINWRSAAVIAPMEPDFPYTITAKSSDPSIVSVEGDTLSFNAFGQVSLTFSSKELGYTTTIPEVRSYEPVKSFSVPEYIFAKFRSSGLISVSDVVPEKNTNPVYLWYRPEKEGVLGAHTAGIESYKMYDVNVPGAFPFTVTAGSGVSRSFTFVHYETINSAVFSPFAGYTATGMTVTPPITVTVDGVAYENIPATYTLTSSNTDVARPTADGRLELLTPGTATITAKFIGGSTARQTITVVGENVYAIAGGVTAIEAEAFLACPVTIAVIPDGCRSIGARAFASCTNLRRVEIPASAVSIAEDAFAGCSAGLVIAAPAGSAAAAFAHAHGYTFEAL